MFQLKPSCPAVPLAALIGALAIQAAVVPATAQTRSPEIAAKERSDPAAGDVVILNSSKTKQSAPDPYAPIKLKPLPADRAAPASTASKKPDAPAKTAAAPAANPSTNVSAGAVAESAPPLPRLNKNAAARLRQFPQAPLAGPANDAFPTASPPREARRPEEPGSDSSARNDDAREFSRDIPRRRVARDDEDDRAYRPRREPETYRREPPRGERPWGLCRQFALRCEDGFARACDRWRRTCS